MKYILDIKNSFYGNIHRGMGVNLMQHLLALDVLQSSSNFNPFSIALNYNEYPNSGWVHFAGFPFSDSNRLREYAYNNRIGGQSIFMSSCRYLVQSHPRLGNVYKEIPGCQEAKDKALNDLLNANNKKKWFLDADNDGYHAKGSSLKLQEQSPGNDWREGVSKGEDCDDTNNGKFRLISGICFDECDLLKTAQETYNLNGTLKQSAFTNTIALPSELWSGWRLANISDLDLGENFQFSNNISGFDSSLFVKENGNQKIYIYATRGTDEGVDWIANLVNGAGLGIVANQYSQSIQNAKILHNKILNIPNSVLIFTGNSLGGGLASANALATGRNAITYNAAGIGPSTINTFNLDVSLSNTLINAIVVREEILNTYLGNIGLGADGKITILEGQDSKAVDFYKKLADEQYSKGRQSINDLNFAKAYGFYKNGVKIELVKDYTRLGLHAIGVISNILNCD